MTFETPKNPNYCGVVVKLSQFTALVKGEGGRLDCNNVKAASIMGNSVIVSIDVEPGTVGVYFPAETALSKEFLGANNLYRKAEFGNVNPEAKGGYFEEHGRIRTVKFRGHKSEGFWIPLNSLSYLGIDLSEFPVGTEFDMVGEKEICRKYIPKRNRVSNPCAPKGKKARVEDKLIDNQFRFHIDTAQLRRNVHRMEPGQLISISDKWHGTSAIFMHGLVKKTGLAERLLPYFSFDVLSKFPKLKNSWVGSKILSKIENKINSALWFVGSNLVKGLTKVERKIGVVFGADEIPTEYGLTWASRRVIKGVDGEAKKGAVHFYSDDIWGIVAKEIEDKIPKGVTLYGEIVGYMPNGGKAVQSMKGNPYHYGCQPDTHRFLVYRITTTNADGKVVEYSWLQMKEFCAKVGLEMVKELYYGFAGDFGTGELWLLAEAAKGGHPDDLAKWQDAFLKEVEDLWVHDQMCPYNDMAVPAEGVIIRVERLDECESYKLKSFLFLKGETEDLDAGVIDTETAEGLEDDEEEVVV